MIRYTTLKLKNFVSYETIFSLDYVDTSDSILSQDIKDVPSITDQFAVVRMKTVAHSWLSAEEHACKVLCQIKKSDYELISFKKKQLDDKLEEAFDPF